jgi:hypothetical protein
MPLFHYAGWLFLPLCIFAYPSLATLFVRQEAPCVASVVVLGQESFKEGHAVHSVFSSRVIDSKGCGDVKQGEQLYFAAPGGRVGDYESRVNGLEVEVGQEATVHLSNASNFLGVPYLMQTFAQTAPRQSQTPAFLCARVPPKGPSLYWRNRTVVMRPSISYDSNLPQETLIEAMEWAAAQWSGRNGADFRFVIGEPTDQRWVGYDWSHTRPNYNIVTVRKPSGTDFYSDWAHKTNVLAMTSITFVHRTGEIVDADIELNADLYEFTDCHKRPVMCLSSSRFDTNNTMTHEFGHVAGFDHPEILEDGTMMTMYAESAPGEITKRWLSEEDISGITFLYPQGQETPDCFGLARAQPSQFHVGLDTGCSQTKNTHEWLLFSLLAMFALLQRKRLFR